MNSETGTTIYDTVTYEMILASELRMGCIHIMHLIKETAETLPLGAAYLVEYKQSIVWITSCHPTVKGKEKKKVRQEKEKETKEDAIRIKAHKGNSELISSYVLL